MTELTLSFVFIVPMLLAWLLTVKKIFPILLLFPIVINSYTLFLNEGLMWADIGLLSWFLFAIMYASLSPIFGFKIGAVTYLWGALLVAQLLINVLHLSLGNFNGSIFQIVVTPLHMYLPLLVLVLILENRSADLDRLWRSYNRLIFPMLLVIVFLALVAGNVVDDLKQIPGVAGAAGFVAVVYPIWLAFYSQGKPKMKVTLFTFLFLILSHTRGALIVCLLLSMAVWMTNGNIKKNKKILVFFGGVVLVGVLSVGILFFPSLIPNSILSIVNLYKGIFLSQGELLTSRELKIESGDLMRFMLWGHALDVWSNNFLLGLGSGQFESSSLFTDREQNLSPHHAVLSVAVDGGLIAVLASLLPQFFLLSKTRRGVSNEDRIIFHFTWLHILMSFALGYAYNFIYIVAFYLSRRATEIQTSSKASQRIV